MMKTALPLALLLLLPVAGHADTWRTEIGPAVAEAKAGNKLLLVDLYAEWCGWCKELERQVFSTPRFQSYAKQFVLLRVDTEDGGEGSKLARRFGAFNLPTTLILDTNLASAGTVTGFSPTEEFIAQIERELAAHRAYEQRIARSGGLQELKAISELAAEAHARQDGARAAALLRRTLAMETDQARVARTRFLLANSLRMGRQFDEAAKELAVARSAAGKLADQDLIERADLLAYNIAEDRGDCQQAMVALEDFLRLHPRSGFSSQAAQTLATLRTDKATCT